MAKTLQIVNGDVVESNVTGKPLWLSGSAKLRQDLGEALTVDEQTDGFGFGIRELVGRINDSDFGGIPLLLSRHVRRGTERLVSLMRKQRTQRTDAETLSRLSFVKATTASGNQTDTDYQFQAEFLSVEGDAISRVGVISTQQRGV